MPEFSQRSLERLSDCHDDLVVLFATVVAEYDCTVICGHRTKGAQEIAFMDQKTTVHWPDSKHNSMPSMAADVGPYPLAWDDIGSFYIFAGWVLCVARRLYTEGRITHRVRFGGDWDTDGKTTDQKFNDLVHFELVSP